MSFAHNGLRRRLASAAFFAGPGPGLLGPPVPAVADEPPTRARPVGTEAVRRTVPPFPASAAEVAAASAAEIAAAAGAVPAVAALSDLGMVPAPADAAGPLAATSVDGGSAGLAAGDSTFGGTGRATPRWLSRDSSDRDELATRNPRVHGAMPETEGNLTAPWTGWTGGDQCICDGRGIPPEKHLTRPW